MARTAASRPSARVEADTPFSLRTIVAIIVGIFMVILDGTAVNVALPRLVRDFHATLPTLQWTITGYALAQAAVIPLAGWLSDRFGPKRVFLLSVALFTLGSVLCSTAQGASMLIAFRVLQGLGGGCLMPVAMAYVYRLSPPDKVGSVMGMLGVPILIAPAVGPVVAGWLVQYATWRWIFLLNLPIGIAGVFVGLRTLPSVARQTSAAIDLLGSILGPLAFAALSFGLSEGSTSWTSVQTLGGLVVGGLALLAFIVVEARRQNPLLELRVFASRDFSLAIVVQWVGQLALFGTLFLVPLFLQQARGYGAFETGLILLPQALASAVFMPMGGVLFDRIGARPLVMAGLGAVAVAAFLLSHVSVTTHGPDLILPLALSGAGMGLMMMPLNTHLLNAAPRSLVSRVTSLTSALQQVVNSLSIAGLSTILTSRVTAHVAAVRTALAAHARHASAGAGAVPAHAGAHVPPQVQAMMSGAVATAFDDTFKVMVIAAIVGAIMGLVLRRIRVTQASPADAAAAATGTGESDAPVASSFFPGQDTVQTDSTGLCLREA